MIKTKEQLDCIVSNLSNEIVLNNITKTLNDNTTKEVVRDAVNEKLGEIKLEQKRVTEDYNKYAKICNTNEHLKQIFLDEGVLGFYSKRLGFEVTPELMKKVLKKSTEIKKQDTKKQLQTGRSKFNGQRSKDEIDSIIGRYSCSSNLDTKKYDYDRAPKYSLDYKLKYISLSDIYNIFAITKSKDGSEMPNVFTLDDCISKETFIDKEGDSRDISFLGINIVSLNGFPLQSDGDNCYDRSKTDVLGVMNKNTMEVVSYSKDCENKLCKFMYKNCLIESFLRALTNLGYEEDIWEFIIDLKSKVKKSNSPNLLNGLHISDTVFRVNKSENGNRLYKIFSYRNQQYLYYENCELLDKKFLFELMDDIVAHIAKKYNYDKNYLLSCVTFYGGHDYTHQGDDTTNYFNTNPNYITSSSSKPVATNNSSPKPVSTASNTHEITDNFVKYSSKSFEKQYKNNYVSRMRFTYKGKDSVILSPRHECKKKKGCFCHADIIYSIVEQLLNNGVSVDTIVSHDKYMLKAEHIQDEPRKNDTEAKKDNLQLDLGDGRYYYDSNYTTADSVISSVVALVNDDRLPFELEFEFVSKK